MLCCMHETLQKVCIATFHIIYNAGFKVYLKRLFDSGDHAPLHAMIAARGEVLSGSKGSFRRNEQIVERGKGTGHAKKTIMSVTQNGGICHKKRVEQGEDQQGRGAVPNEGASPEQQHEEEEDSRSSPQVLAR